MSRILPLATALFLLPFFWVNGADAENAKMSISSIPEGITEVDFDGDGTNELLVKARRENFNSHSYDFITVYKKTADGKFVVVPFIIPEYKNFKRIVRDYLQTRFNSEWGCEIRIFALSRPKSGTGKIVEAEQEGKPMKPHGKTFPVGFRTYEFHHDQTQSPGTPEWYFSGSKLTWVGSGQCDLKFSETPE
jgi:hypothetical protein